MASILFSPGTMTTRNDNETIEQHIKRHELDAFFNEVLRVEILNSQVDATEDAQL